METCSVELGASTHAKLRGLLIEYLDHFRTDDSHAGSLYPFDEDALDPAMDAARLYPRDTLRYAYFILQKAVRDGVPPRIGRDFVHDFVAAEPHLPVEGEDNLFELPPSATDLRA